MLTAYTIQPSLSKLRVLYKSLIMLKMNSKQILLVLTILPLIHLSCSKAKSDRWLVGDIQLVDADTQEPITGRLDLSYYEFSTFGSEAAEKELGFTDDEGHFEIKYKSGTKEKNFQLLVYPEGPYYLPNWMGGPVKTVELNKNGKNELTIELTKVITTSITLNNASCFDETDSVWIRFPNVETFGSTAYTGCLNDSLLDYSYGTYDQNVQFATVSKKNSIYDTLYHDFTLSKDAENNVVINY